MKIRIILDTSALIAGYEASSEAEHYTTPSVKEELGEAGLPLLRLETAIHTGRLKMMEPEKRYLDQVRSTAAELGEAGKLSEADMEVLAIGLQLKALGEHPLIISDDYSLQNIADRFGLDYRGMATQGIKRRIRWEVYCPGCRGRFKGLSPDAQCPICGTRLKRRPIEKGPVRSDGRRSIQLNL